MSAETFSWLLIIGIICGIGSILALLADVWTTWQERRQWFRPMATPKPMTKDEQFSETCKRG